MEREWHVLIDKKRYGPYTFENLKSYVKEGRVRPDTLVWKKGYKGWVAASKVPELLDMFGGSKPVNPKGETHEDLAPAAETTPQVAVEEQPQPAAVEPQADGAAETKPEEPAAETTPDEQPQPEPQADAQPQAEAAPQEQPAEETPAELEKKRSSISRIQKAVKKAVTAQPSVEIPLPNLLPNETIAKEAKVVNKKFAFLTSGQTRIAVTDRRLLFSIARTFEVPYWILIALFPPLLFYYYFRVRQNRRSAIQIDQITGVEKIHRPSVGLLFAAGTAMLYWYVLNPYLFMDTDVHWILRELVTWLVYAGIACLGLFLMWANRTTALVVWTGGARHVLEAGQLDTPGLESDFDGLFAALQERLK